MRAPASRPVLSLALLLLLSGTPALLAARADAAGDLELSTAALTYGPVTPGPGTTTRAVDVINNGDADAVVGSPSISGPDKASFWASETCGGGSGGSTTLGPGDHCTITVDFAAATPGARSATMSVPSSVGPALSVTLSAITRLPHITTGGSGSFATTAVGDSRTRDITVTSNGVIAADIGDATVTGSDASQFSVIGDTCALADEVVPGDSCTVTVRFRPTVAGAKSATLSIPSDAGSAVTVPLTGSTGTATMVASTPSITFPATVVGASTRSPLVVSNTGVGDVAWTSATISGTNANQFAVDDSCQFAERIGTVPCSLQVYFRPTATGGKNATLTLSAAGQPDVVVPLSGTGSAQVKTISTSPSSLGFGSFPVGSTAGPSSFTITNTGNVSQVIGQDTFGVPATNYVYDLNCPQPLAPGEQCTGLVWFRPSTSGALNATLTVVGTGTTATVGLSGTGVTGTPGITFNPTTARQFGGVAVGSTSGTFTQTISNAGPTSFAVNGSPSVTGPSAAQFQIQGGTCNPGFPVNPGGSCTVTMRFAPTSMGLKAGVLTIPTTIGGPPMSFSLNGFGTRGYPNLSTSALDFPATRFGVATATQVVTVTNTGNGPMTGSAPTIDGPQSGDFTIASSDCGSLVMAKGDTCTVSVRFTPGARGPRSATLHVASTSGVERAVALTGSGLRPTISADTSTLAYGDQPVGPASAPLTVTLTNNGDASLNLGAASLTGTNADQFVVAPSNGCSGATVAPGDSCLATVQFDPTSRGSKLATLSFANDAGPATTIGLSGFGTRAVASLNPPSRDFGAVAVAHPSAPVTVTVTNIGNDPMRPGDLSFGGADPGAFDLMNSSCVGATVAPSASCSISVRFNPGSAGSKSATLTLPHNGANSPSVITLSGVGLAPVADPSTTAVDFGEVRLGQGAERLVTLTNSGTADLVVGTAALTGPSDFFVVGDGCSGHTVSPGDHCGVTLGFQPLSRGTKTGSLSIPHNATGSPTTVSLTAVGITPVPQVSDDEVDFGSVDRGTTSSTTTLTVSNVGNTGLSVGSAFIGGVDHDQFVIGADHCGGTTVAPDDSCTIDVRFAPTTVGEKDAFLGIPTDALTSTTVDLTGVGVPKSDLKILGIGSLYTGKGHLVTRTVKTSGTVMKYKLGVVNEDGQATSYKFRLDPSGAAATAQVWSTGVGAHVLPTDGAGNFVTGTILPAKTVTYELRVTPTVAGQVTSAVDVSLLSSVDGLIEKVSTQTNTAAPLNGTSGFELFATQGSQPMIGGPVDGQTASSPALNVGQSASFRVRLKNNGTTAHPIGLRVGETDGCSGSFTVTVKAGTTVITAAAVAGSYVTPSLGAGKYKDITVVVKRIAVACPAKRIRVQSLDGGAVVRTSYLQTNASYNAALD
ncbi:choice-of-anchor D domain-containing protein [Nocardioides sp. MH1]|uniref:choice-of-anchor D domain-containing protein n=1 Tax=Nocardioides sp. MH1 TaxID=3242490 RepID=UPI0035205EAA